LQHGVQNPDIIHQFYSESHFDNCSVFLNVGFSNGFATMTQRFEWARQNAVGNPEFLAPHYTSFLDISADVAAALAALATDPECLLQPACPTAQAAADAALIGSFLPALARIFHNWIEQRSGEGVRRLENTEPNENATRRFFCDRL
jgi:hypothetical protein